MTLSKEEKHELEYLLSLKKVTKVDVIRLQGFINRHIDKHCQICAKCGGQIRFTHNRLRNWAAQHNPKIEEEINEGEDLCLNCNNIIHDKRRKDFCSTECKKDYKVTA